MRRCAKCGCRILIEQEIVATEEKLIRCYVCKQESKPMPFMWMARIAWNRQQNKLRSEK